MGEYLKPTQEQEQPTPQQLNAQLNTLFNLLPQDTREDQYFEEMTQAEEEWNVARLLGDQRKMQQLMEKIEKKDAELHAYVERHEQSGYAYPLRNRVTSLVSQAPVTDHMKQLVTTQFSTWLLAGIPPEPDKEWFDTHFFFLDRGNPDIGGIFNPQRARQLEEFAITREINRLARRAENFEEEGWSHGRIRAAILPGATEIMGWRAQINRCYKPRVRR